MGHVHELQQLRGLDPADWEETEEGRLYWALSRAVDDLAVVGLLHEGLELNESQIARGCGVQPSSVSRWLSREVSDVKRPGRLGDLKLTVRSLLKSRVMTVDLLRYWLTDDRDLLLGEAPLLAIARGRYVDVIDAGMSLLDPAGPTTKREFDERHRDAQRRAGAARAVVAQAS